MKLPLPSPRFAVFAIRENRSRMTVEAAYETLRVQLEDVSARAHDMETDDLSFIWLIEDNVFLVGDGIPIYSNGEQSSVITFAAPRHRRHAEMKACRECMDLMQFILSFRPVRQANATTN